MSSEPPPRAPEVLDENGPGRPDRKFAASLRARDLVILFLVAVAGVQGAALLGALVMADLVPRVGAIVTVLGILAFQATALFLTVYFVILRRRRLTWSDLGLRPASPAWLRRAGLAALLALPVTWAINAAVQSVIGRDIENPQLAALAPLGLTWTGFIGLLALVGFVMPLAEEILFRGILYRWLRAHMNVPLAAVISALGFSVLHGVPTLIPAIAALGVGLALIYEASGSLWTAVLTHALYNTLTLVLLFGLFRAGLEIP